MVTSGDEAVGSSRCEILRDSYSRAFDGIMFVPGRFNGLEVTVLRRSEYPHDEPNQKDRNDE